jgi:steroid delta-isomerase-like uncharacterized protein
MQMSTTEHSPSELVRIGIDCINSHDPNGVVQFGDEEQVGHYPLVGQLDGRDAVRDYFAAIFASYPDVQLDIEQMASEGESVFAHWHMTGTFSGAALRGIPATGRPFDIRGTDYFSFRDGKIVSVFVAYDGLDLATQIGLMPPSGP